jgi:heavy metal efflux system protein
MIEKVVRLALQQRLLILIISVVLLIAGLIATKRLSVDAFPDVTNVQVQIASEAPGRSPEEVERFVTIPIELSMTGLPGLVEMRSLNRNGISIVTLVFTEKNRYLFCKAIGFRAFDRGCFAHANWCRPGFGAALNRLR